MKKTILTASSLLLTASLSAQWVKVDDMETYTVDTELDADETVEGATGVWNFYADPESYSVLPFFGVRADPLDVGQGLVLEMDPGVGGPETNGNGTLERELPEEAKIVDNIANPTLSTLYFKFARPIVEGSPSQSDTTWGLVAEDARNADTGVHAYGSYSVLGRIEIDGIIDIRDGVDYVDLVTTPINTETWYEYWFVIDHSNNTFSQYVRGGTDFPEQTMVYEDAAYRFETFDDLATLLLVTTTGAPDSRKGIDPVYFDDFYIDPTSENLASPSGEGGGSGGSAGNLTNLSTRGFVGTGDNIMIGGFSVDKTSTVLIRTAGPAISVAPFNVPGTIADPQMTVVSAADQSTVAENDNWGDAEGVAEAIAATGAFAFAEGSADAGVVVTVEPGTYTILVSGADGGEGVAIIEVFLMAAAAGNGDG